MGARKLSGVDVAALTRSDSWEAVHAVVVGFDTAGAAVADNLLFLGAQVTALDEVAATNSERAELLAQLGATIRCETGATTQLPSGTDLVVLSPGFELSHPLARQAHAAGVPVWSDLELGWRLRSTAAGSTTGEPVPWIVITGAHGVTEAVQMSAAIAIESGVRAAIAGPAGRPIVEVVMDPEGCDLVVVEADFAQLAASSSVQAESAAVMNVDPERTGDPSYLAALGRAYEGVRAACVYAVESPETRDLVEAADVVEGARGIGITLGMPTVGMLGLVEDIVVDRAFIAERSTSAAELCTLADLGVSAESEAPLVIAALVAAALTRAHGASQQSVRDGLRRYAADR